jgi:sigma-B regulation protein RsbU (phosphoserine phosphatase)
MYSSPFVSKQLLPADLARLTLEMDLARQVQFSLLPKNPPSIPGLDLSSFFQPASHVGGDFYDFIVNPDQSLTFFVGDVSGNGMPAAMLMTMTRAILRAETNSPVVPTPEDILQNANARLLADFVQAGMFVTVFVGRYYPINKELVFANAGHSAVIFRPVHGRSRLLQADGPPLGIQEKSLSKDHRVFLTEGDLLVVTTDGLYEARNSQNKSFGVQRLLNLVQRLNGQSAIEFSNTLLETVGQFSGYEPQTDDQTIMILRCTSESIR